MKVLRNSRKLREAKKWKSPGK